METFIYAFFWVICSQVSFILRAAGGCGALPAMAMPHTMEEDEGWHLNQLQPPEAYQVDT